MKGLELLEQYRKKMESDDIKDRYAALGYALQLPGICGRLEFPPDESNIVSGKNDKKGLYEKRSKEEDGYRVCDRRMFKYWFNKHKSYFASLFSLYVGFDELLDKLYDLRNAVTHEGIVHTMYGQIVLVDDRTACGIVTGRYLFLPIYRFCDNVFNAVESIFRRYDVDFSDCGMPCDLYDVIQKFVYKQFHEFWDTKSQEDNSLNLLYDLCFNNIGLLRHVDTYFKENPDAIYEHHMRHISIPDDIVFFKDKITPTYSDEKVVDGIVCRINKRQFNRMKEVVRELNEYGENVDNEVLKIIKEYENI